MKATPFSSEPYYPMLLSNGQDGIFVNYSGTNLCPFSGHDLYSQTLGASCGWYKASTRATTGKYIAQVVRAGIRTEAVGTDCMPSHYEQSMDAHTGILTTKLTFLKKIHVTVESFLTDNGIWGEKVTVEKCPEGLDFKIGFGVIVPNTGVSWTTYQHSADFHVEISENEIPFSYTIDTKKGIGVLLPSASFSRVSKGIDSYFHPTGKAIGMHETVCEGDSFSRLMICVDETECDDLSAEFENKKKLAAIGYDALHEAHIKSYRERNCKTWVSIPDERVQGIYDISRYHIDGNFNRRSGAASLGLLPHLWGGGLHCSYDATFIFTPLMQAGNREAAQKYNQFFIKQGEMGKTALENIGMEGTAFSGWTDCYGNFGRRDKDLASWLTNYKPMFIFCELINRYVVWKYTDRTLDEKSKEILFECARFIENRLIRKTDEGYRLIDVASGTENGLCVEADTMTVLQLSLAMRGISEMLDDPKYLEIANDVKDSISENYREDGVLMPYKDATHTAGGQLDYYIYSMPDSIGIESVDAALKDGKTPWGYTFDQPTEEKRHWPWIHPRAAICYAHEGKSQDAMEHLLGMPNFSSALGAIPEYIRMDGLPTNYYYTTSHGLVAWAIHDAFAHMQKDTVRLLWGMTDAWKDVSCEKIHLENRLQVSIEVTKAVLNEITFINPTCDDITINLRVNPVFTKGISLEKEYIIKANDTLIIQK